jgi:hypothetical protein
MWISGLALFVANRPRAAKLWKTLASFSGIFWMSSRTVNRCSAAGVTSVDIFPTHSPEAAHGGGHGTGTLIRSTRTRYTANEIDYEYALNKKIRGVEFVYSE